MLCIAVTPNDKPEALGYAEPQHTQRCNYLLLTVTGPVAVPLFAGVEPADVLFPTMDPLAVSVVSKSVLFDGIFMVGGTKRGVGWRVDEASGELA